MPLKRLNDLELVEEYCFAPKEYECKAYQCCYSDEHQCRYFRQVFKRNCDDFYTIRDGNKWYQSDKEI